MRARPVLGRGRRVDDLCIDLRARSQCDTLVGQMCVRIRRDGLRQPVPLQQMTEVEDRALTRNPVIPQFDPGESTYRFAVVGCLPGHRVARRIPVLQQIDP